MIKMTFLPCLSFFLFWICFKVLFPLSLSISQRLNKLFTNVSFWSFFDRHGTSDAANCKNILFYWIQTIFLQKTIIGGKSVKNSTDQKISPKIAKKVGKWGGWGWGGVIKIFLSMKNSCRPKMIVWSSASFIGPTFAQRLSYPKFLKILKARGS